MHVNTFRRRFEQLEGGPISSLGLRESAQSEGLRTGGQLGVESLPALQQPIRAVHLLKRR